MTEQKTVLFDLHNKLAAKMVAFGGYLMPLQYKSILEEHRATRQHATLFDTCHMGEFRFYDGNALDDLERLVSCCIGSMKIGQCRYGFICNPDGGVIDDQITYRLGENEFFMVVNAATQKGDYDWITSHLSPSTQHKDLSLETAKIDLQGPNAAKMLQKLLEESIDGMRFYSFRHNRYRGKPILVSRTGYTGEIGFEMYSEPDLAASIWNDCMDLGAQPAGLGARDTLRLEMCFPLYGHELRSDINAAESGLLNAIATDKEFIGSNKVRDESQRKNLLVSMVLADRRSARPDDRLVNSSGEEIGFITSGSFSPTLGKSIAMGYVHKPLSEPGTTISVKTERHQLTATIDKAPLYKESTGRKKLKNFL